MTEYHLMEVALNRFSDFLQKRNLLDEPIAVRANPLTPQQAIGHPERQDFPILIGRERMLEAVFKGAKGHAFTDTPDDFDGSLSQVIHLPLDTNRNRAILIATMNAVLRYFNEVEGTVHCKDDDPERCAVEIAEQLKAQHGQIRIGLIGLNPAIGEALAKAFGVERVLISDLNPDNVGHDKFGVQVLDGATDTDRLIEQSDFILVTGTTLGNGSFDPILKKIIELQKKYMLYGVTCAAVCQLLDLPRICPRGYNA